MEMWLVTIELDNKVIYFVAYFFKTPFSSSVRT